MAVACLLGAAERKLRAAELGRVDPDHPDFEPVGDRVVASADSSELGRIAFPARSLASTPAAYLTGYLAGLRAKAKGTAEAVLDAGLHHPTPGGRLAAALKGLLDAGVQIPHGEDRFPSADRLGGAHLPHPLPEPLESYKMKLPSLLAPKEVSA